MAKTIQVRDVPDDVYRTLRIRAAEAGLSLSDYIRRDLERSAARPTVDELAARVAARGPSALRTSTVLAALHQSRG